MHLQEHTARSGIVKRALIVFSPWLIAMLAIVASGLGCDTLSRFKNIEGNRFIINDVLFVLIMSSYGVVLVGLVFSLLETRDDLFEYKSSNPHIKTLDSWGGVGLACVLILLAVYVTAIVLALLGIARFSVEALVSTNRWLSLIIFGLFSGTDYLALQSKRLQEAEEQGKKKDSHLGQVRSLKEFYELAILLIDVPAFTMSGLMIFLAWYMGSGSYFKGVIDRELHFYISTEPLSSDVFSLFVHGTEAGVISSIIIFSQIIYLVLKTRCERTIAAAPTAPLAAIGSPLPVK